MNLKLKPVLAGLVGVAAAAALAPLAFSGAASAAPTPQGAPTITGASGVGEITSGDSSDIWSLRIPVGSACGGDGNDGYRIQGYMVSAAINPATLVFNSEGPQPFAFGNPQSAVRLPLYDPFGTPYLAAPAVESGTVVNIPDLTYNVWTPGDIPAGEYNVGIACVFNDRVEEYWNVKKTVTPNTGDGAGNFNWGRGGVAAAPTGVSAVAAKDQCTVSFTPGASDPAASSYTATATPVGGGAAVEASGSGSPIVIGGLTNFTAYDIAVTATNAVGESAASSSVSCTPSFTRPGVTNLAAAVSGPGDNSATLSWVAPTGDAPTSYSVVVNGPTPSTRTVPAPASGVELTNLANGSYTVTVTPVHDTLPVNGAAATATFQIRPVVTDPCINPRGLVSGLLSALGLKPLGQAVCRLGLGL